MDVRIRNEKTDTSVILHVVGEVDVSCAEVLRSALADAMREEVAEVVVDLSEVPYIDSTGIGVLVGAAHTAAEADKHLVCERPQRNVERVLSLLRVDAELNVRNN